MKQEDHPPEPPSGDAAQSQAAPPLAAEARPAERWTVDGLEDSPAGPLARLEREDGSTFDLPLRLLPDGVQEGDLLEIRDALGSVTVYLLKTETAARRGAMQARLEALNSAGQNSAGDAGGAEEITV